MEKLAGGGESSPLAESPTKRAERLITMADTEKKTEKVEVKKRSDPFKEMVAIYLPEDPSSDDDTVFVAVNGRTYQIKRGYDVMVPRPVAEVLVNSRRAARVSKIVIDRAQEEFNNAGRK